jgi:hypothetical protein
MRGARQGAGLAELGATRRARVHQRARPTREADVPEVAVAHAAVKARPEVAALVGKRGAGALPAGDEALVLARGTSKGLIRVTPSEPSGAPSSCTAS